jgi:hypothetical protein
MTIAYGQLCNQPKLCLSGGISTIRADIAATFAVCEFPQYIDTYYKNSIFERVWPISWPIISVGCRAGYVIGSRRRLTTITPERTR